MLDSQSTDSLSSGWGTADPGDGAEVLVRNLPIMNLMRANGSPRFFARFRHV